MKQLEKSAKKNHYVYAHLGCFTLLMLLNFATFKTEIEIVDAQIILPYRGVQEPTWLLSYS